MTEDWFLTVNDESEQPYNEHVHLDQTKGSVHAERDTELGFSMRAPSFSAFWQDILQNAETPVMRP